MLLQQLFPGRMQDYERFAAFLASDLHIVPAKLRADARAEGLGNGFLGRKTRRQERRRHAMRQAVADFVRVQNALQKSLAKPFVRGRDPRHFDDVNSNA